MHWELLQQCDAAVSSFVIRGACHSPSAGCLAAVLIGPSHNGAKLPLWKSSLGAAASPVAPWRCTPLDGCMFGWRSPGGEAIRRPLLLWSNFEIASACLRCRFAVDDALEKADAADSAPEREPSATAAGVAAVATPFRSEPAMPCAPGQVAASPASGVDERTEEERAAAEKKRAPLAAAAKAEWLRRAKAGEFDAVHTPDSCFARSGSGGGNPRRTDAYRAEVVAAVGLDAPAEGYAHLSEADRNVLRSLVWRKAEAFWMDESERTCMRGFMHDVVTSGLPIRGHPIRLRGEDGEFVRREMEEGVRQGLYVRGTSPWGSWAFPTRADLSGRRRRTVVDYRLVNRRMVLFTYYIRRCSDVKGDLVGSAFLSGLDGARGFNLLRNTAKAKEVLAVLTADGVFLPEVLQLGPSTGPFDFQYVTDELFTSCGHGRFGRCWKNYIDDFFVRTGRWLEGRALTDAEFEEVLAAAKEEKTGPTETSRPLVDALQAAGFSGTRKASLPYTGVSAVLLGCLSPVAAASSISTKAAVVGSFNLLILRSAKFMWDFIGAAEDTLASASSSFGVIAESGTAAVASVVDEAGAGARAYVRDFFVDLAWVSRWLLAAVAMFYLAKRFCSRRAATNGELAVSGLSAACRANPEGDGPRILELTPGVKASPQGPPGSASRSARALRDGRVEEYALSPFVSGPPYPRPCWSEESALQLSAEELIPLQAAISKALPDIEREAGERGRRGRDLSARAPLRAIRKNYNFYDLDVAGSSDKVYRVLTRLEDVADAKCSCPDFVFQGRSSDRTVCKHIVAGFIDVLCVNPCDLPPPEPLVLKAPGPSSATAEVIRDLRSLNGRVVDLESELAAAKGELTAAKDELDGARSQIELLKGKAEVGDEAWDRCAKENQLRGEESVWRGIRFLEAASSMEEWGRVIASARSEVRLLCYTFDHDAVVRALVDARRRHVRVKMLYSHQDRRSCKNQSQCCQELVAAGCHVRGHKGPRCHAKWILGDDVLVLGSTNFSNASQLNVERGVRMRGVPPADLDHMRKQFDDMFEGAHVFESGVGLASAMPAPLTPMK